MICGDDICGPHKRNAWKVQTWMLPAVWSMAWGQLPFPAARSDRSNSNDPTGRDRSLSQCEPLEQASGAFHASGGAWPHPEACQRNARLWPDRARSQEISVASSDATADGRYRNITYERRLERRRWLPADEIATNGGRVRTPFGPPRSRACSRAS